MDQAVGASEERLPLGTSVGRYRLIAMLGSGGMANVYLAVMRERVGFNKLVVLKIPHDTVAEDPSMLAMFMDEARLAARLNHRNVIQTYEVIEESGRDVIVMEYLDGQTLSQTLVRAKKVGKPMSLGLQVRVMVEALHGLHYAHELKDHSGVSLGLVHRDMSPQNIFLTFDGQVKVLDFGVAKATISSHVTEAGTFKGKVRYMPREQFAGRDVDRRADIFAVGVVLWEAATHRKMWENVPDIEVMSQVIAGNIPPAREINPEIDGQLDAIIQRATSLDKVDRYPTCVELQADLERYLATLSTDQSLADAATFVSDLFAETRAKRTKLIDQQVARSESELSTEVGILAVGELGPVSVANLSILGRDDASSRSVGSGSSAVSGIRGAKSIPIPSPPVVVSAPPPAPRSNVGIAIAVLVTLAVCCGTLGLFAWWKRAHPDEARSAAVAVPPAATVASAPVPPVAPPEAKLSLAAKTPKAKLFLDDEELTENPVLRTVPKDGTSHTLRVEAPGFVTQTMPLRYDSDKEIVVMLDAAPAVIAQPSPAWRPAPARAGTAAVVTPTSKPIVIPTPAPPAGEPKRPNRPIDDTL